MIKQASQAVAINKHLNKVWNASTVNPYHSNDTIKSLLNLNKHNSGTKALHLLACGLLDNPHLVI